MMMKRLIISFLAVAMNLGCFGISRGEEAAPAQNGPEGGAVAGAVVSDLIYVPGKVLTCILGGAFWTGAMVITAGTIYKEAGNFVHEACTGKWVIRGADMTGAKD